MLDSRKSERFAKGKVMAIQQQLESSRVIAIVRGTYELSAFRAMAEALLAGGIRLIEVTMNTPGVLDALKLLTAEYGDRMVVGAGTVLSPFQVAQVAATGAKFVVAPNTMPEVIAATKDHGLISIPGAFTATEVYQAHLAGADYVKLFPSGPVGADYLKAMRGPMDKVKFVATGGIELKNAKAFLDAGAVAVGMGNWLVSTNFDGSATAVADLTDRSRQLLASLQPNPRLQLA